MKLSKKTNSEESPKGLLVQLRVTSKDGSQLTPYEAWDMLAKALKDHPVLSVERAEFRVEKPEEKTGI